MVNLDRERLPNPPPSYHAPTPNPGQPPQRNVTVAPSSLSGASPPSPNLVPLGLGPTHRPPGTIHLNTTPLSLGSLSPLDSKQPPLAAPTCNLPSVQGGACRLTPTGTLSSSGAKAVHRGRAVGRANGNGNNEHWNTPGNATTTPAQTHSNSMAAPVPYWSPYTGAWRRNPWWVPPLLGEVPPNVDSHHLRQLGALSFALFFEEYDLAMLTSALSHLSTDLSIPESDLGHYLGIIRLGALPALLLIPLSDKLGRRGVFIPAVVLTGLATFFTAFVTTSQQFTLLQWISRACFTTCSSVAFVIIAEAFPSSSRGWGLGTLGALGAGGHGLAALLFSFIHQLPYGWRSLYAVGLTPVLMLPLFMSSVSETERFKEHLHKKNGTSGWQGGEEGGRPSTSSLAGTGHPEPSAGLAAVASAFCQLLASGKLRFLGIVVVGLLPGFGLVPAFQFSGYYVQRTHHWTPGEYSSMVILGGAMGICASSTVGRGADRYGRRRMGSLMLLLFPLFVMAFYWGPASTLALSWIGFLFCAAGGRIILRAMSTEMFPTALRGTATGLYVVLDSIGSASALLLLSYLHKNPGDLPSMIPILSFTVWIGAFVILLFPETSKRELNDVDYNAATPALPVAQTPPNCPTPPPLP